jgi:signal transduction histidine kinase
VNLEVHPGDRDLWVNAGPAELFQVICNLLTNAVQAMPSGGFVDLALQAGEEAPGEEVELLVTDTGTGIRTEDLGRVFDPFFTTKPPGQGTGLGLSAVHGLVADLGGRVELVSSPGLGTTVRVVLPGVDEAPGVP